MQPRARLRAQAVLAASRRAEYADCNGATTAVGVRLPAIIALAGSSTLKAALMAD